MELEGYELVMRATDLALRIRQQVNGHPLISKYFRILTPAEMVPAEYRESGIDDYVKSAGIRAQIIDSWRRDEIALDPTRLTLVCGTAGYDGTAFKALLAEQYDIQINKTSRNSILVQTNINNTRSDVAHIVKVLADIARRIDEELRQGGEVERAAFAARVKALMEDVPDLPNFSRFHAAFREDAKSATAEGHMREAFYTAYRNEDCEYLPLASKDVDQRAREGPGDGGGGFRHSVSAGLSDHGARAGHHGGHHRVHAQARREGNPRLSRGEGAASAADSRAAETPQDLKRDGEI